MSSGYQQKSNHSVAVSQSGLPFLLFLSVTKSVPATGILARAISSFRGIFMSKRSTISELSDQCMIWDSSMVLILSRRFTLASIVSHWLSLQGGYIDLTEETYLFLNRWKKQIGDSAHCLCKLLFESHNAIFKGCRCGNYRCNKNVSDQGSAHFQKSSRGHTEPV